ncbi:MAG: glycosyltransferase [Gammaproteobacteria bacterium]
MKIVHMILSRGFAGSERATAEMCNAQCTRHEVLLILKRGHTNRAGVSITQWVDPRVRVVEVGNWFPQAGIARALAEFQPDVIHAHLRRPTKMLARIKPRAATLATLHITVNGPHFAALDGIVCIAQWQHKDIPAGYTGIVRDINLAYIPHRILSQEEIAAIRLDLGVQPNEFLVGGVGRLARSKGFDTLIEAFKRANLRHSKLVILGEGRERKRLERLGGNGVSLPGFRTNAKDFYQAFDLFVCPSRREPLPYVLLEALDAGVPVIASTALGNAELLKVYPGDLFAVENTEALVKLLHKHHEARGARARQDLSPYMLDTIVEQTEAVYLDLIEAKRRLREAAAGAAAAPKPQAALAPALDQPADEVLK